MLELIIWTLMGALCGWIGYLAVSAENKNLKLYLLIGIISATIAGRASIGLGALSTTQININSLLVAAFVSSVSVLALGLISNHPSH